MLNIICQKNLAFFQYQLQRQNLSIDPHVNFFSLSQPKRKVLKSKIETKLRKDLFCEFVNFVDFTLTSSLKKTENFRSGL
jgi:hypothetical protein